MKLYYRHFTILLLFFAFSCGSKKKIAQQEKNGARVERTAETGPDVRRRNYIPQTVADYIDIYAPVAKEEMALYKIPASITLAQGILESGVGKSLLTVKANNHFGIKCHGWQGQKVYHDDDAAQECFRKYKDSKYSYRDHSLFLTERKRYADLFKLSIEDYEGWAYGLRKAGYATDRAYPTKLISIIERYQLYKYDAQVLGSGMIAYEVKEDPFGGAEEYRVKKGDTLYSISRRYNLSVEQLKRYNNLTGNTIAIGQTLKLGPDTKNY